MSDLPDRLRKFSYVRTLAPAASDLMQEAADRIEEHRDCRGVAFLESELAAKDRRIAELEAAIRAHRDDGGVTTATADRALWALIDGGTDE